MKKTIPLLLSIFLLAGIARAQVPNAGMENWITNFGYEDPQDWNTFNIISAFVGAPATVNKTTDAHSGSFAATVESITYIDTMGTTHELLGLLYTEFPNTIRFANFSFWYKFNNAGGDTAVVGAILTKWNSATQEPDSVGFAFIPITSNVGAYTQVNLPIQYFNSVIPDTAYVFVFSNVTENFIAGSKLWVDDFSFSGISSISEISAVNASVYPNPAITELNLELENPIKGRIEIYDSNGKRLRICELNGNNISLPVADLPRNTYIYNIIDNSGRAVKSGKVILGQ